MRNKGGDKMTDLGEVSKAIEVLQDQIDREENPEKQQRLRAKIDELVDEMGKTDEELDKSTVDKSIFELWTYLYDQSSKQLRDLDKASYNNELRKVLVECEDLKKRLEQKDEFINSLWKTIVDSKYSIKKV